MMKHEIGTQHLELLINMPVWRPKIKGVGQRGLVCFCEGSKLGGSVRARARLWMAMEKHVMVALFEQQFWGFDSACVHQ